MSTGMKKPPIAPKPRVIQPQKPSPPPIAPKPDVTPSCPSPAPVIRAKPAVAPKPCLPKDPATPDFRTATRKVEVSKTDSDYIIPTSDLGQRGYPHCQLSNGCESNQIIIESLENLQNLGEDGNRKQVSPGPRVSGKMETVYDKTGSGKSQVFNANFLEQRLKDVLVQAVSPNNCHVKNPSQEKIPVLNGRAGISNQNLNLFQKARSQSLSERSQSDEDNSNFTLPDEGQPEDDSQPEEISVDSPEGDEEEVEQSSEPYPIYQVPAAPRKPLPVPAPRKPRKAALVRQDGLDEKQGDAERSEEEVKGMSVVRSSSFLSPKVLIHTQSVTYSRSPVANQDHSSPSKGLGVEEDSTLPVPPPRRTSLSPALAKRSDSSYTSLSRERGEGYEVTSLNCSTSETIHSADEEEEDGYGFACYPNTRSLPKQIKLNCSLPLSVAARGTFSEERSPKMAPKKPQRHSLPASGLMRKDASVDSPEGKGEGVGAVGKRDGADDRPHVSKNGSTSTVQVTSSTPNQGKPRAKSFSAADLVRADGQKRSSFRKLLELKLSVKMLPKLLAKGSHSLDCTSVEREQSVDGEWLPGELSDPLAGSWCESPGSTLVSRRKMSCPVIGVEQSVDGDEFYVETNAEYENLPFYEEIPEYMNLPLLNATHLDWHNSSSMEDGDEDIYEEPEPYEFNKTYDPHERLSLPTHQRGDREELPSGSGGMIDSSDEEDDASSASSKGETEHSEDRQHEIEEKKNKVFHIAKEIMSSEKVFVDVLKLLHIDFRDAVSKASRQTGKAVVEDRVLNQILYYLPQLYELNRDLLRELEDRVARWDDQQCLADIFVKKGPYLKMYSTYIREFDRNVALLDEQCRKNPGFAAAVREFEMSPRCANLALKHYLLKPVQRIPQYQLLLTDYLKKLPDDASDYKDTQAALSIVKEVANHANDSMKQGDNFQKLMQIQYSLNGQHEIVQPGRVFLKEGILKKLSRKVMQPRMFFLFNDALLYTTPVQSGQFKLNCLLSLAGMKVSKPSQEGYQNELNIESVERPSSSRPVALCVSVLCSSATERDEWLEAISRAIEDFTRKKITFVSSKSQEEGGGVGTDSGAPLGSKAPIWIPDLRATMCMICTCEFTLTWRRHHCRACGKVVCQACSTHKHYLEYLKNQAARVCDHCFLKLEHRSDQVESSPSGKFSSVLIASRKQKKIPAALKEVSANTENSSMSGYLLRSKGNRKQWKKLWFVIKNKVLYTYAASEDVAALESQPLLGFFLREEKSGEAQKLQFKLYHKNTLFYIFKAEDVQTAQRWIFAFQEAMIL
ncbi:hypothetical protein GJAV_G00269500 [Gymnothorax javanicus]|nr:hypothetical protein GJAV_G00269500 [Gymnothorax javanicus]